MSTRTVARGVRHQRDRRPRTASDASVPAASPDGGRSAAGWRPLGGVDLLDRLRSTGRARPPVDPALAVDLRRFVERGLADVVATTDAAPTLVTAHRLTGALACPAHRHGGPDDQPVTGPMALGALVEVLFRQWVTLGAIDDAFDDALGALAVDDRRGRLCAWIADLPPTDRAELRAEVERQADGLRHRWPALDPTWLPRTQEAIRATLVPGRVELAVWVDLALGHRAGHSGGDRASVALVQVTSGMRRPGHRDDAHLAAVAETLRSGAPPFVVATYHARTGELDVDPVTPDLLGVAARRLVTGIRGMHPTRRAVDPPTGGDLWCAGCAADPFRVGPTMAALPTGVGHGVTAPHAAAPDGVVPFPGERAA